MNSGLGSRDATTWPWDGININDISKRIVKSSYNKTKKGNNTEFI